MKYIKIILAIILASVLVFMVVSCGSKNQEKDNVKIINGFKSYTEQIGADRFLGTDWGMSLEQTLKSLNLTENDVEAYQIGDLQENAPIKRYKVKEKMEVNGLQADVILCLYDEGQIGYYGVSSDKSDLKIGLAEVMVLFNEADTQTVIDAFSKELGDKENLQNNKSLSEYAKNDVTTQKAKLGDIKSKDLKESYINLFASQDDSFKESLEEINMYSLTVGDVKKPYCDEEYLNASQIAHYNGMGVAVINSLNQ